jgi:hypothetical protein
MKDLKIFNTFSGKKENFTPLDPTISRFMLVAQLYTIMLMLVMQGWQLYLIPL